jgi:hypothetical protein
MTTELVITRNSCELAKVSSGEPMSGFVYTYHLRAGTVMVPSSYPAFYTSFKLVVSGRAGKNA